MLFIWKLNYRIKWMPNELPNSYKRITLNSSYLVLRQLHTIRICLLKNLSRLLIVSGKEACNHYS